MNKTRMIINTVLAIAFILFTFKFISDGNWVLGVISIAGASIASYNFIDEWTK